MNKQNTLIKIIFFAILLTAANFEIISFLSCSPGYYKNLLFWQINFCYFLLLFSITLFSSINKYFFRIITIIILLSFLINLVAWIGIKIVFSDDITISAISVLSAKKNNIESGQFNYFLKDIILNKYKHLSLTDTISIILYLLSILFIQHYSTIKKRNAVLWSLLALSITFIFPAQIITIRNLPPFSILTGVGEYFTEKYFLDKSKNNPLSYQNKPNSIEKINIVLILGESLPYYKYNLLNNLKNKDNLIFFNNFYANYTLTHSAVKCILYLDCLTSTKYIDISSTFNKSNFDTYHITNDNALEYPAYKHAFRSANNFITTNPLQNPNKYFDENIVNIFAQNLNSDTNNFYLLHLKGSHFPYITKTPSDFKNNCDKENLNSYDCSVKYADFLNAKILNLAKNTNSLVIFLSDHGESLGENGFYTHGLPIEVAPEEQTHIPLFFWASKGLLNNKKFEQLWVNLKRNQARKIDQTYMFHTILGCSGASSDLINSNKNLCANT